MKVAPGILLLLFVCTTSAKRELVFFKEPASNQLNSSGNWTLEDQVGQWLQVNLSHITNITAIGIQGHSQHDRWTTQYLLYSSCDGEYWQPYEKKLLGNADNNTVVKEELDPPIVARFLRIYPRDYHRFRTSRLELYGCTSDCSAALGLQHGSLPGSLTASSARSDGAAAQAPLRSSGGWAARDRQGQWLQVSLNISTNITAVATQGRAGYYWVQGPEYYMWTKRYLLYSSCDGEYWQPYGKELRGNADRNTVVRQELDPPIVTQFLRIYPLEYQYKPALRLELYGCAAGAVCRTSATQGCSSALGLQNDSIPESSLSASSISNNNTAATAHLNSRGGWAAYGKGQWLQVTLMNVTKMTAIATQGHPTMDCWTEQYLLYSSCDGKSWQPYGKEFRGNADKETIVKQELVPPIVARFLRIYPLNYSSALRLELYGCAAGAVCTPSTLQECNSTLGLEDRSLLDPALNASSAWAGHEATKARLHSVGSWAANYKAGMWLQVALNSATNITAIATQGHYSDKYWTKLYNLSSSLDGNGWQRYGKELRGNADKNTVVRQELEPPIVTQFLRIYPLEYHRYPALRLELYGCAAGFSRSRQISPSAGLTPEITKHATAATSVREEPSVSPGTVPTPRVSTSHSHASSTRNGCGTRPGVMRFTDDVRVSSSSTPTPRAFTSQPRATLEPSASSPTGSTGSTVSSPSPTLGTTDKVKRLVASRLRELDPKNESSLQDAGTLLDSFFVEEDRPTDGASVWAVTEQAQEFYLEYAQNHLNNTDNVTMTMEKFDVQIRKMVPERSMKIPGLGSAASARHSVMELPSGTFGNESAFLVAMTYKGMEAVLAKTAESQFQLHPNVITVTAKSKKKKLEKNVRIIIKHLEGEPVAGPVQCVFWRPHRFDPGGKWSKTGCRLVRSIPSQTECSCDHMTSFTILMPVQNEIPDADITALTIITDVGMYLSIIAEVLILLSFFLLSDVTDPRSQVRANLAAALLLGQVVFLTGIGSTSNSTACVAVALLLQFFYLAAFCWMSVEAFLLYVYVVQVFADFEMKMPLLYCFAWGVPGSLALESLIKTLTEDGSKPSFVHQDHCWLSPDNSMSWVFNSTMGLLLAVNFIVLMCVIRELASLKDNPNSSEADSAWKAAKGAALLCPLLGITWMIGFLNFSGTLLITEYLFAILNSTQGLLIFILHTLRNRQLRSKAKRKLNNLFGFHYPGSNRDAARRRNQISSSPVPSPKTAWGEDTRRTRRRFFNKPGSKACQVKPLNYVD